VTMIATDPIQEKLKLAARSFLTALHEHDFDEPEHPPNAQSLV